MTEINYLVGKKSGTIFWAAAEHFKELEEKTFNLAEMEATKIERSPVFSLTAKILLSAVAGAIIQHLIDSGFEPDEIFNNGLFMIKTPTAISTT